MEAGETKPVLLHATRILYQHWSPAFLACIKEQSAMSMETGDDSGATGREVTDPPIGVVDAVAMHRMTRRRTAKKSRFTWFHHGTTPNSGSMYIVNEWNQKDEILIHHLLAEQPWKACHGHIMAAWDSLLENVLTEK